QETSEFKSRCKKGRAGELQGGTPAGPRAFQYAQNARPALNLAGPFLHREVVRSIPVKRLAVQHERPKQKSRLGNPRGFRSSPRRGLATTKYSKISQETVGGWLTRVGAPFCSALP